MDNALGQDSLPPSAFLTPRNPISPEQRLRGTQTTLRSLNPVDAIQEEGSEAAEGRGQEEQRLGGFPTHGRNNNKDEIESISE